MTSDLQQNRYDQLIRRVGGIIGPGSKVAEALSELFPVIDVERVPGELLLLGGTQLCAGAGTRTGAVGEVARIQLFNPVGSGKLVTVSLLIVSSSTVSNIRVAWNITALTLGIGTEVFRDRRLAATSRPIGQIRTDSTVAFTDPNLNFRALGNTPYFLKDVNSLGVLPPGSGLEISNDNTNTQIFCSFLWRERVAIDSELLFP